MGNTTSTNNGFFFPHHNRYLISYCKQKNYSENISPGEKQKNYVLESSVELSAELNIIDSYDLIYHVILNEVNKQGYSIKPTKFYFNNGPLERMIQECNYFSSSDSTNALDDIKIVPTCYVPTLHNIKHLLSEKKMLIAGIIIDNELKRSLTDESNESSVSTDVICILGYTQSDSILIKTGWTNPVIELKSTFIENIKEMWSIDISLPENTKQIPLN
jgi:hypothetical protein